MITFLYKQREDGTYVIAHKGNPYHVIEEDELWGQCVEEYAALDEEPPDEPEPKSPEMGGAVNDTDLIKRIEALEAKAR
jgi:hypothetical protein